MVDKYKKEWSLEQQIKYSDEYYKWRLSVLRDHNFICDICGKEGRQKTDKKADQKLPVLYTINKLGVKELIKVYNVTSFEDALKCQPLWDVSQGVVKCFDCFYKGLQKKVDRQFLKK